MRRFIVTNPNLSVGRPGDVVTADQLRMTDAKLDEWVAAGFGTEVFEWTGPPLDLSHDDLVTHPEPDLDTPFDPGEHTISQVLSHLDEHPEDLDSVIALERSGKQRVTILDLAVDPVVED